MTMATDESVTDSDNISGPTDGDKDLDSPGMHFT
jgi:hypothetical protein